MYRWNWSSAKIFILQFFRRSVFSNLPSSSHLHHTSIFMLWCTFVLNEDIVCSEWECWETFERRLSLRCPTGVWAHRVSRTYTQFQRPKKLSELYDRKCTYCVMCYQLILGQFSKHTNSCGVICRQTTAAPYSATPSVRFYRTTTR